MKRRGFTLIEMLVSLVIFGIIATIVVVDFRMINEREYLKQTSVDFANTLQSLQTKSLGNYQSPDCTSPCKSIGYGLLWSVPTGIPATFVSAMYLNDSAFYRALPDGTVTFRTNKIYLEQVQHEVGTFDPIHSAWSYSYVALTDYSLALFMSPSAKPLLWSSPNVAELGAPIVGAATRPIRFYFKHHDLNLCRRVQLDPSGRVTEAKIPCACITSPNDSQCATL